MVDTRSLLVQLSIVTTVVHVFAPAIMRSFCTFRRQEWDSSSPYHQDTALEEDIVEWDVASCTPRRCVAHSEKMVWQFLFQYKCLTLSNIHDGNSKVISWLIEDAVKTPSQS